MKCQRFERLIQQALESLPEEFRKRIQNLAIIVEDMPTGQEDPEPLLQRSPDEDLLMGEFIGIPKTEKSAWDMAPAPDHIVLYRKNIEAVCSTNGEIREEIRLTILHELGHYFGMTEEQLEDI